MSARNADTRIRYCVLGPLVLEIDGLPVDVPGDKLKVLLGLLTLEHGRRVSDDRLVDVLWPGEPPPTARESLRVHVSRLRKLVGDAAIRRDAGGFVLDVEHAAVDAATFDELVQEARGLREIDVERACERFREAETLWRGGAVCDVAFDRLPAEAVRLEELRLVALEERLDAELAAGLGPALVPELEALVDAHPLRERLRGQLMLALYAGGRQSDALGAYHATRETFVSELGIEPGPELRALERRILDHDPGLPGAASARSRLVQRRLRIAGPILVAAVVAAAALAAAAFSDGRTNGPSTEVVPNSLVELDASTGDVKSVIPMPEGPDAIAVTPDALWVTSVVARTTSRVDRATREVDVVGGVAAAGDVAASATGQVWVGNLRDNGVTLINAPGLDFRQRTPRIPVHGGAVSLDVGGGVLWVTVVGGDAEPGAVERIDPVTRQPLGVTPVGAFPASVVFAHGHAWVANYNEGTVDVVDPSGRDVGTIRVGSGPITVAASPQSVWVAMFWTNEVVRIDPERRAVVARIRVGEGVWGVATGPDTVWVANRDSSSLSRIDSRTNRVTATIPFAAPPYGVAYVDGRLWVTTQECGSPNVPCDPTP